MTQFCSEYFIKRRTPLELASSALSTSITAFWTMGLNCLEEMVWFLLGFGLGLFKQTAWFSIVKESITGPRENNNTNKKSQHEWQIVLLKNLYSTLGMDEWLVYWCWDQSCSYLYLILGWVNSSHRNVENRSKITPFSPLDMQHYSMWPDLIFHISTLFELYSSVPSASRNIPTSWIYLMPLCLVLSVVDNSTGSPCPGWRYFAIQIAYPISKGCDIWFWIPHHQGHSLCISSVSAVEMKVLNHNIDCLFLQETSATPWFTPPFPVNPHLLPRYYLLQL